MRVLDRTSSVTPGTTLENQCGPARITFLTSKTGEQLHWILRGMRLHSGISNAGSDNGRKVWRTLQKPDVHPYRYSRARLHDSLALVLGALTTRVDSGEERNYRANIRVVLAD
jgi:hypothetical protein